MGILRRHRAAVGGLAAALGPLAAFTASAGQQAGTITAVCEAPVGRAIGLTDHASGPKYVDHGDFVHGGRFRFVWTADAATAHMIRSGSPGTEPTSSYVDIVRADGNTITFVAPQGRSVWMHTLFLETEVLLVSEHAEGSAGSAGGALNRSAVAACTVTDAAERAPADQPPMTPQTMRAPPPPSGSGSSR